MGGYFIVNGIEKVIRMLIMQRRNYPIALSRPKWKTRGQGYTQYGEYIRPEKPPPNGSGADLFDRQPGFCRLQGISMRCVKEDHTAINMTLHYLDNGTVMLNFIYQKELFFLPLGFALKVGRSGDGPQTRTLCCSRVSPRREFIGVCWPPGSGGLHRLPDLPRADQGPRR